MNTKSPSKCLNHHLKLEYLSPWFSDAVLLLFASVRAAVEALPLAPLLAAALGLFALFVGLGNIQTYVYRYIDVHTNILYIGAILICCFIYLSKHIHIHMGYFCIL